MSQKPAAKMTVWAWNSSHLDSFLAVALSLQDSFLFLASEFHFGHFFFSRIYSNKYLNILLYSWLLVVGYGYSTMVGKISVHLQIHLQTPKGRH
jgi:hypothetical protein